MPELPDILVYVDALERTVVGRMAERVLVRSPFVVRSFDPPIDAIEGKMITGMRCLVCSRMIGRGRLRNWND